MGCCEIHDSRCVVTRSGTDLVCRTRGRGAASQGREESSQRERVDMCAPADCWRLCRYPHHAVPRACAATLAGCTRSQPRRTGQLLRLRRSSREGSHCCSPLPPALLPHRVAQAPSRVLPRQLEQEPALQARPPRPWAQLLLALAPAAEPSVPLRPPQQTPAQARVQHLHLSMLSQCMLMHRAGKSGGLQACGGRRMGPCAPPGV